VLAAVAAIGVAIPAIAIVRAPDTVRPMTSGDPAPAFALPRVGSGGELGAPLALSSTAGKVTVLDFWATWCGPCRAWLPRLDALARAHPELAVITINTDDPVAARALFDRHHYALPLVEDDGVTAARYRVSSYPHTVLIDRTGTVRGVYEGAGPSVEAAIEAMLR
jgi:thiol-disulfide isomerase/thioredoxin